MSNRFYAPEPPQGGLYHLVGDEARHLTRVSRHGVGDTVELFDGQGFATRARVVECGRDRVELVAEGEPLVEPLPARLLTLATAIPKGDRFDWLVEKATELSVSRLIPLVTERSVVDPRDSKLERLRRTIVEACKQSCRSQLMVLEVVTAWSDLVSRAGPELRLMARREGMSPGCCLASGDSREILLAVGPEGGFTDAEIGLARDRGWESIRLGANVLRVETAAIAGAAVILARYHEEGDHART